VQQDIHKLPVVTVKKQESLKERLSKPLPKAQTATTSKTGSPEVEVTRREEWIMRQRYSHYTLQLMANEKIDAIYQFINRHKLKNSIALYKTVQNEKPWYVLIYGIYSNQQLAESGINLLPADLQLVKPSIRKFEDIQKDIRKVPT
jgi:DamX protein